MTNPFSLDGSAFLPSASRKVAARLDVADHNGQTWVRIIGAGEEELARDILASVQIDPALGRTPRKLTFSDGTVFETPDHAGFQHIDGDSYWSKLHRLERFSPHLVGFTLACLAAAYLLWRYGLDALAGIAVAMTPMVVVEQIDRGTLQTLDYVMAEPSRLPQSEKDRALVIYERVVAALPEKERKARDFKLLFRDMPEVGANAFALPGGTMVMTDDLIQDFPSEDVLAGILGHEVGHVVEEHGLRRLYRSLGAYVLIALLAGETGPMLEDVLLEGNALLSLSYGRDQESAADEFGLALSHQAGYDPAGLKEFFETLAKEMGEPPQWMSSHPNHDNRVQAIDAFIKGLPAR
ncbi:MAG: M48 family metallopeptidase [Planktotalea sp.]|uniref:M48 family metallopeptidase n=1 Tax=Planktotalea sp. TaxID=2029877 RepID=UPI003C714869